jgi:hypothetical protein
MEPAISTLTALEVRPLGVHVGEAIDDGAGATDIKMSKIENAHISS